MPTNVKEPVQLKRPQGKKLPIDKSVWEQAEQVGILYSSDTQSRLGSKSKRKKKNQQKTGMDSSRFAVSKLLCLLFFVPSDTMKNNLGKPLTGGLSPEGCFGSLTASFELFLRSRQIYHTHTHKAPFK